MHRSTEALNLPLRCVSDILQSVHWLQDEGRQVRVIEER